MQESLCEISRWFRKEQQQQQKMQNVHRSDYDEEEDVSTEDHEPMEEDEEEGPRVRAESCGESSSASSRDTWTPVHVEPTYGPCQRCYPRNLKFGGMSGHHHHGGSNGSSHVTPPPTPPEERDKFECLYLLVDTAISRMERERGKPWK